MLLEGSSTLVPFPPGLFCLVWTLRFSSYWDYLHGSWPWAHHPLQDANLINPFVPKFQKLQTCRRGLEEITGATCKLTNKCLHARSSFNQLVVYPNPTHSSGDNFLTSRAEIDKEKQMLNPITHFSCNKPLTLYLFCIGIRFCYKHYSRYNVRTIILL